MTTATRGAAPIAAQDQPAFRRKRWTGEDLDRMVELGILREGGPEFLWDGEIVEKMGENTPHNQALDFLLDALADRLDRADWCIRLDHPVDLREGYRPEPDLVVARGPRIRYQARRPVPADIGLLVEVASTSYAIDSGSMLQGYAAAGIVQYWIVNVDGRRVEVYRNPRIEAGVGAYDPPELYPITASVPLVLSAVGDDREWQYPAIPVAEIIRDAPRTP